MGSTPVPCASKAPAIELNESNVIQRFDIGDLMGGAYTNSLSARMRATVLGAIG
jgi:hypothetical protein